MGPPMTAQAGQNILVVEDEFLIRFSISDYLRDCGYHVVEAADAAEAVEAVDSDMDIDLVFSDVQMPGAMNGLGLAKWVREHHPHVSVILTSGHAFTSDVDGVEAPIPKPYDDRHIVKRIRGALAK